MATAEVGLRRRPGRKRARPVVIGEQSTTNDCLAGVRVIDFHGIVRSNRGRAGVKKARRGVVHLGRQVACNRASIYSITTDPVSINLCVPHKAHKWVVR